MSDREPDAQRPEAPQKFVFLDRDGTLVRDTGYPHRVPQDYALLSGVPEALLRLASAGWRLAIVTNQSGIGRGLFDTAAYERFAAHLVADLGAHGVEIAGSFHCPHAPDAGCGCRKPRPGLFFAARDALGADLAASWMIGDASRDVEAARAAGCRGAVLVGDSVASDWPGAVARPSLRDAVEHILSHS